MRVLSFFLVYLVVFILGFVCRARFDIWMYRKPHMQQRIRVFAAQVFDDPDPVGVTDYLPPPTTDSLAMSPAATEAWLQQVSDYVPDAEPDYDDAGSGPGRPEGPGAGTAGSS